MSDAVNFAEIDGQLVELLPARTVMQAAGNAVVGDVDGDGDVDRDDERLARDLVDRNGDGVIDANDANAQGAIDANVLSGIGVLGTGSASAGDGIGGPGGSAGE